MTRRIRAVGEAAVPDWVAREARRFQYPDFDTIGPPAQAGGGGGAPTVVVAASNATDLSKAKADFVCTGVDDHTIIQQALNLIDGPFPGLGGRLLLTEGQFNVDGNSMRLADITAQSSVTVEGMGFGTQLEMTSAGVCFDLNSDGSIIRNLRVRGEFTGDVAVSTTPGIDNWILENLWLQDLNDAAIALGSGNARWFIHKVIVDTALIGIQTDTDPAQGVISNCNILTDNQGILIDEGTRLLIQGTHIQAGTNGIELTATSTALVIAENTIYQPGGDGILIDGDRHLVEHNKVIAAPASTDHGINVAGGDCNIVVGNDLGPAADYAIDAINDAGTNTQLFYPADPTYGDNFTDCTSPGSP